ncbi:hypothetical protein CEW83_18825 [Parazoarcus communis]|uniref:Polysaccharide pyruvyl transferase domain-containing protein n=1 Tax=Parazoarcus communis TaxID=41977 RepID=A0A2U8GTX0_9RHOO|nr:hypothetical protein CEW83_18825 [Parazoarcus communis]
MNLYWCKTTPPNVGDALNEWIWPRLIPELEQLFPESVLFGIGSILDERINSHRTTYVIGSGARGPAHGVKIRHDLHVMAVRGPLTAEALGIDECKSTTDPAALLAYHYVRPSSRAAQIGVVPYFSSPHDFWQEIANEMGLSLISPHMSVPDFLDSISQCDFVISEAMHGAIIADALRIPWYPIRSNSIEREGMTNKFKWTDWCSSIGIDFKPKDLPPIWPRQPGLLSAAKYRLKRFEITRVLHGIINGRVRYLSNELVFRERTEKLLSIIHEFRTSPAR